MIYSRGGPVCPSSPSGEHRWREEERPEWIEDSCRDCGSSIRLPKPEARTLSASGVEEARV